MSRSNIPVAPLVRLFRRKPWLLLALLPLVGAWYALEVLVLRPPMSYAGLPQASSWNPRTWTRVLRNDGFMLGYSDLRGNPLWVTFELRPIAADAPRYKRPQRFSVDWRNLTRIDHDDYTRSGYDRGHMAPNYAISRLYGRDAQRETFLMTNITPQRPKLNQKLWQRIEELEADYFAPRYKDLWVVTGPVFDNDIQRLKSAARVEVPDAFFRIWAVPPQRPGDAPQMLAFLVPQTVKGTEPLTRFVVSVDKVEQLTGFDFFSELPDGEENAAEASSDSKPWGLAKVARRAPRF